MSHCSKISDYSLKELAKIKTLKHVYVCDSNVSDAGLFALTTVPMLEELDVSACLLITDTGLQKFASSVGKSIRDCSFLK
jgi:hypothetical protein